MGYGVLAHRPVPTIEGNMVYGGPSYPLSPRIRTSQSYQGDQPCTIGLPIVEG